MNKKQRNRKLVTQNKRNRMINRRYISTIKTLSKLFQLKVQNISSNVEEKEKNNLKNICINLYSILDKAVKKGVIHKNKAARKKSKFGKIIQKI